jgi:hypothetical protein
LWRELEYVVARSLHKDLLNLTCSHCKPKVLATSCQSNKLSELGNSEVEIYEVEMIPELEISEVEMISELQQAVKTDPTQGNHDVLVDCESTVDRFHTLQHTIPTQMFLLLQATRTIYALQFELCV